MATLTKSVTENQVSDSPKATWTFTLTGANYSVTTISQTISASNITGTAKYVGSGKTKCYVGTLYASVRTTKGDGTTYYASTIDKYRGDYGSELVVSSGTTFSLYDSSSSAFNVTASTLFNSSNPTEKTKALILVDGYVDCWTYNSNYTEGNGYTGNISFSPNTIGTITYACPPELATCSISKDTSAGYYAGLTTATVSVPITYSASGTTGTAKYGGYIKQIDVTIGGQTVTKTFTESTKPSTTQTLSIDLANVGTFTPTVTVTDSRDQTVTQTLADITVNPYNDPSVNFDIFRADANGVKNDEGTYGLINATITYTDAVATLTEPAVTIDGTATSNVTWYSSYNSTTGVQGLTPISDWSLLTPLNHAITVYGLVNGSFNTEQSYTISMTDTDSLGGESQTVTQTLSTAFYTIDFQAGGKEIAFGAPANDNLTSYPNGLFKCDMDVIINGDAKFNGDLTAVGDVTLSTGDTEIENPYFSLDTTAPSGTTDGDLYATITALNWNSDVIANLLLDVKKLLTKITDWIGDKSYTGYGTGVNITSYNSSSNMYTVPSDGIIIVNGNYRSGSYAILYNQNGDTIAEASAGGSANSAGNTLITVPVYKGMKYYSKVSSGYSYIWYYPYV